MVAPLRIALAFALSCLLPPGLAWGQKDSLPPLSAAVDHITVSGVSSGGYMAVQFQVAHSRAVRGAGVLAAGPYYCAQGNAWRARHACMKPSRVWSLPDVRTLQSATRSIATMGLIDAPEHLGDDRVWLFSGGADETVTREVVDALRAWYLGFIPETQVTLVDRIEAGHAMVTADYGAKCRETKAPFLNDCDFDAAGALLAHLYGKLQPPSASQAGDLSRFDQREYAASPFAISMDDWGYVYVPRVCRDGGCRVHVAFHGCRQGAQSVGEAFVAHAGYNRWADTNRLIVLYPQAIARSGWGPWPWPSSFVYNPNGCWDWWGYSGADYHTQRGGQISAVMRMLEQLQTRSAPQ
jgi:poly(3-hydroxybutyrate) depolymerase